MIEFRTEDIQRLLLSEAEQNFDSRESIPHQLIVSSITVENSARFISVLMEAISNLSTSSNFVPLMRVVSRVLHEADIIEIEDRRRFKRFLVKLGNPLTRTSSQMEVILNCLNSLWIKLYTDDVNIFECYKNHYPYQWEKALVLLGDIDRLKADIGLFLSTGNLNNAEVKQHIEFLERFVSNALADEFHNKISMNFLVGRSPDNATNVGFNFDEDSMIDKPDQFNAATLH